MSASVRRLERQDLEALLALYRHLHRQDDPVDERTAVAAWEMFQSCDHFFCFGGFDGSDLLSSCTLAVIPNLTRGDRPFGVIENVVTRSDRRGQGWGRAVVAHALSEAWSRRCHKVELSTGRKDEEIVRFYESAGFDSGARRSFVARRPK